MSDSPSSSVSSQPSAPPTLTVSLFAGMAAAAGTRQLEIPWRGGTAAELRRALGIAVPAVADLVAKSAVAVGTAYIADDALVPAHGSVAIVPPVSGG